ncbi:hypothetical protein NDU88_003128 [Pleurodeles waltl]|uniref:Uncharacterized protein n=1 Tax=Pleurodeles waltl TaxID=8319 RepID=A0AAV7SCX0_PLEWA|nr:hypothetical protein NDU88_003128 [Pleurodeles waltl]
MKDLITGGRAQRSCRWRARLHPSAPVRALLRPFLSRTDWSTPVGSFNHTTAGYFVACPRVAPGFCRHLSRPQLPRLVQV